MLPKDKAIAAPGQVAMDRGGCAELHVRAQVIHLDVCASDDASFLTFWFFHLMVLPQSCNSHSLHRVLQAL